MNHYVPKYVMSTARVKIRLQTKPLKTFIEPEKEGRTTKLCCFSVAFAVAQK
jgi:hypothetical protein